MTDKIGRNDPCFCGSGKKYKNCCWGKEGKQQGLKKKMAAKWLNAPRPVNLIERTFGSAIAQSEEYKPADQSEEFRPLVEPEGEEKENQSNS